MSETRTQTGGINIEGPANVGGDMVTGDKAGGDKVLGNKIVQEAAAPIAFSLHQLPAPPTDFVGREQEIADILRNLDKGAIISGVYGMGGIGKTALALVIADRLKVRYPDAQFFLDLRGASDKPMSPVEAMAHVVRAYYPTSKLPDDGTELQGLYCSVLEGKKALVLMDNAKDAAQITPLLPPATCLLLITSRQHFAVPGLRSKDLNVLPPDKARELLISIADRIGACADGIANCAAICRKHCEPPQV